MCQDDAVRGGEVRVGGEVLLLLSNQLLESGLLGTHLVLWVRTEVWRERGRPREGGREGSNPNRDREYANNKLSLTQ